MAIFSFKPPSPGWRRETPTPPADWAETRPAPFADSEFADARFAPMGFEADPPVSSEQPAEVTAAPAEGVGPAAPNPGFAKALTARPHNDEPLGAGWYISSWDLLQGCDVIEGAPIDILPPEWQRKRPRP